MSVGGNLVWVGGSGGDGLGSPHPGALAQTRQQQLSIPPPCGAAIVQLPDRDLRRAACSSIQRDVVGRGPAAHQGRMAVAGHPPAPHGDLDLPPVTPKRGVLAPAAGGWGGCMGEAGECTSWTRHTAAAGCPNRQPSPRAAHLSACSCCWRRQQRMCCRSGCSASMPPLCSRHAGKWLCPQACRSASYTCLPGPCLSLATDTCIK